MVIIKMNFSGEGRIVIEMKYKVPAFAEISLLTYLYYESPTTAVLSIN